MPPVYQKMLDEIRQGIELGKLPPGEKFGTEIEWVGKTGLSRMTVRKAIDVLMEKGLVERRPGKGLYVASSPTSTLRFRLIVPGIGGRHAMWAKVAEGCREACRNQDVNLLIYAADAVLDKDIEHIEGLADAEVDGALIGWLAHYRFSEAVHTLKKSGTPFVLLDETIEHMRVPSVMADHYQGGYEVGVRLIEAGHRRIGFVGPMASNTIHKRVMGLRDAMADAGLPVDRGLLGDIEVEDPLSDWDASIERTTRVIMKKRNPPTAIFYCSDDVALAGCRALRELGLSIPGDISVVGFGGEYAHRFLDPPLSTMCQSSQEVGRRAMQMLLSQVRADSSGDPPTAPVVVPPVWVDGGTLGQRQ